MTETQALPPTSESELLSRCKAIEGKSIAALAGDLGIMVPDDPLKRKGLTGSLIEKALGTTAGTQAKPDFDKLGIELKTMPLGPNGKPCESTFVTSIQLLTVHQETWEGSSCYAKLKRVLWVPVEGDRVIPYHQRRIGQGFLWSANAVDMAILKNDWEMLTFMLASGKLEALDASMGEYLQVRPKAANSRALCYGFGEQGNKVLTLPRGFYLRAGFTGNIIQQYGLNQ